MATRLNLKWLRRHGLADDQPITESEFVSKGQLVGVAATTDGEGG